MEQYRIDLLDETPSMPPGDVMLRIIAMDSVAQAKFFHTVTADAQLQSFQIKQKKNMFVLRLTLAYLIYCSDCLAATDTNKRVLVR